jgi:hypothetical protein
VIIRIIIVFALLTGEKIFSILLYSKSHGGEFIPRGNMTGLITLVFSGLKLDAVYGRFAVLCVPLVVPARVPWFKYFSVVAFPISQFVLFIALRIFYGEDAEWAFRGPNPFHAYITCAIISSLLCSPFYAWSFYRFSSKRGRVI